MLKQRFFIQYRATADGPWLEHRENYPKFCYAEHEAEAHLWQNKWTAARVVMRTYHPDASVVTSYTNIKRTRAWWVPRETN